MKNIGPVIFAAVVIVLILLIICMFTGLLGQFRLSTSVVALVVIFGVSLTIGLLRKYFDKK